MTTWLPYSQGAVTLRAQLGYPMITIDLSELPYTHN